MTELVTGMLCASLASASPYIDAKFGTCFAATCPVLGLGIGGDFSERYAGELGVYMSGKSGVTWTGTYLAGKLKFQTDSDKTSPYAKLGYVNSRYDTAKDIVSRPDKRTLYMAAGMEYKLSSTFYLIGDIAHVNDHNLNMLTLGLGL